MGSWLDRNHDDSKKDAAFPDVPLYLFFLNVSGRCLCLLFPKDSLSLFSSRPSSPVSSHLRGPFLAAPVSPSREATSTQAATCLSALDRSPATSKSEERRCFTFKLNNNHRCGEIGLITAEENRI